MNQLLKNILYFDYFSFNEIDSINYYIEIYMNDNNQINRYQFKIAEKEINLVQEIMTAHNLDITKCIKYRFINEFIWRKEGRIVKRKKRACLETYYFGYEIPVHQMRAINKTDDLLAFYNYDEYLMGGVVHPSGVISPIYANAVVINKQDDLIKKKVK